MEALRRRLIPRRTIPSSNKAIFRQYVPRDNPAPIGIFLMNEKRVGRGCVVLRQGDITESWCRCHSERGQQPPLDGCGRGGRHQEKGRGGDRGRGGIKRADSGRGCRNHGWGRTPRPACDSCGGNGDGPENLARNRGSLHSGEPGGGRGEFVGQYRVSRHRDGCREAWM